MDVRWQVRPDAIPRRPSAGETAPRVGDRGGRPPARGSRAKRNGRALGVEDGDRGPPHLSPPSETEAEGDEGLPVSGGICLVDCGEEEIPSRRDAIEGLETADQRCVVPFGRRWADRQVGQTLPQPVAQQSGGHDLAVVEAITP